MVNLNLKKSILVDNNSSCFFNNLDNFIPILPFYGDIMDVELKKLEKFIVKLHKEEDYSKILSSVFSLDQFNLSQTYEQLSLYFSKKF